MPKRKRTRLDVIQDALDGLLIPDLIRLVQEYDVSPERIEELKKVVLETYDLSEIAQNDRDDILWLFPYEFVPWPDKPLDVLPEKDGKEYIPQPTMLSVYNWMVTHRPPEPNDIVYTDFHYCLWDTYLMYYHFRVTDLDESLSMVCRFYGEYWLYQDKVIYYDHFRYAMKILNRDTNTWIYIFRYFANELWWLSAFARYWLTLCPPGINPRNVVLTYWMDHASKLLFEQLFQ